MITAEEARRLIGSYGGYDTEEIALNELNIMIEKACRNIQAAILVFNLRDSLGDKLKNYGYEIIKGNTFDNGDIQYIISWRN